MLTLMLGVVGFIGSQYVDQKERISNSEIRISTNAGSIAEIGARVARLDDRRDKDMADIRSSLQRIEDKIDKKADR